LDTIKLQAKKIIEKEINNLADKGIISSKINEDKFNFNCDLTSGKNGLKFLVYFGKKGIKKVLQGNKESDFYFKINEIIFGKEFFEFNNNHLIEPEIYIGTDESGKGDYFGPLVVAGVLVDKKTIIELKKIGVKDSKELTDSVILEIANKINKIIKDRSDIIVINPEKYNELYSKIGNLNRLLACAHAKVLENILSNHSVEEAISDKFGDEKLIIRSLQEKGKKLILHQYTKAERYTAVAAASILARERFIKWFETTKKKYNINFLKGASNKVEQSAKDFIKKYGKEELNKVAKIHFKTTQKIS